jgi:hypothetical protein
MIPPERKIYSLEYSNEKVFRLNNNNAIKRKYFR